MKPLIHKCLAWLLLLVFVHGNVGAAVLSQAQIILAREAMEDALSGRPADTLLIMPATAWETEVVKTGDRDFTWQGACYDLVKTERHGNQLFVHCHKDTRESAAQQQLSVQASDYTAPAHTAPKTAKAESVQLLFFVPHFSSAAFPPSAADALFVPPGHFTSATILPALSPPPELA